MLKHKFSRSYKRDKVMVDQETIHGEKNNNLIQINIIIEYQCPLNVRIYHDY